MTHRSTPVHPRGPTRSLTSTEFPKNFSNELSISSVSSAVDKCDTSKRRQTECHLAQAILKMFVLIGGGRGGGSTENSWLLGQCQI